MKDVLGIDGVKYQRIMEQADPGLLERTGQRSLFTPSPSAPVEPAPPSADEARRILNLQHLAVIRKLPRWPAKERVLIRALHGVKKDAPAAMILYILKLVAAGEGRTASGVQDELCRIDAKRRKVKRGSTPA